MNKFIKVLALVLVVGALLACAACAPSNDNSTTTAPGTTTTPGNSTTTTPTTTTPNSTPTAPSGTTTPTNSSTVPLTLPTKPASAPQKPAGDYTHCVLVIDEDGNIVVGARVQLCYELPSGIGQCMMSTTGADGYAVFKIKEKDLDGISCTINMVTAPDGVTIPAGWKMDDTHYPVAEGETDLVLMFKLVKITA